MAALNLQLSDLRSNAYRSPLGGQVQYVACQISAVMVIIVKYS